MRKLVLASALSGAMLSLAACSGAADETAETTDTAEVETIDDAAAAALDGVSDELAAAIVAGQPYASVTDLNAALLETLGEDEAAQVLVDVFVPVNLNSGTEEEIRLIPGMTDKMVHEFEEYRPYADMGVFDREIGKYVDEAEVERFKNYVTL